MSGVGVRYQVALLEQVGAGVLDTGGLGAGQGMPADEARVVDGGHHRPLGRADVGDHVAVLPRRRQYFRHSGRQSTDRGRHERDVGAADRVGERAAGVGQRAALERRLPHRGLRIPPAHLRAGALARRQADRPADEAHADHGHDGPAWTARHQTTFESTLPSATAAARSTCSAYSAKLSAYSCRGRRSRPRGAGARR